MLYATDTVSLGDVRVSDSGYLDAFARTVRTGIQQYMGRELERPDLGVVNVYRPESEVFSHDSLHSFAQIPVTLDHPPAGVNAKNWRQVARGTTGTEVLRDGEFLRIGLKVKDADAVQAVRDGKCELSAGYRCQLVWEDGIAPDGTPYQAKQVGIVADHVAIVAKGRAGAQCRIGDSWPSDPSGASREPGGHHQRNDHHRETVSMKTLTIDGHSVELSDAALIAVSGLQKQVGTLTADNLKLTADMSKANETHAEAIRAKDAAHADALKAKDTEIATKDAEIEKLKATQVDDAKLDALATARADVIGKARAIVADVKTDGVSIPAIRRAVVVAKLGDAAVKGKSDDYVEARFDLFADAAPKHADPLSRAIANPPTTRTADNAADPHAKRRQQLQDAWKGEAA
ncbi:hypothetical protein SB2_11750 [Methylobacterium radiotolerans]|nr:hypothetical protein SB3_10945 [Methylobacterium radiotolerans]KTS47967.1 hypothetical protein SB2_11750 [Methylobacterium radiotolerans]